MRRNSGEKSFLLWSLLITSTILGSSLLALSAAKAAAPERVDVLVGFKELPGPAEHALVRGGGGRIKYSFDLIPVIAASVPEPAIFGLLMNPKVRYVEPDGEVWVLDTELDNSWGVKRIGAGTVHGYNKGRGVKVAIIDTGIDYTHPDLDDNYAGGYNFVNGNPMFPYYVPEDPMDDHDHGTHVAGIVAAEDNGDGVVGVAPEAMLYALKALDAAGMGYSSNVIAALQWSVNNGIQVVNMSIGGWHSTSLEAACQAASDAGLVLVAAAGNAGNRSGSGDNVIEPARYASVIAVAATDKRDKRATFSSTGPDLELAAPGVDVVSSVIGGQYGLMSGTSMASPHVAGTAALIIASGIKDVNGDGRVNDEVRQRLCATADDLGDPGRDSLYGYGLLDADEGATPPAAVHDVAVTCIAPPWVQAGQVASVYVTVQNRGGYPEAFTVTLTDTTANNLIGSKDVAGLGSDAVETLTFPWGTAACTLGLHLLRAEATAVEFEEDLTDNSLAASVEVKEPIHDVAVTDMYYIPYTGQNRFDVHVMVENQGTCPETFTVRLTDTTDGVQIGQYVVNLLAYAPTDLFFIWDTTNASRGNHLLEATAGPVPDETDTADNSFTITVTLSSKLHVVVSTDKPTYTVGERVNITVTVRENSASGPLVQGASVRIWVRTPTAKRYSYDATTDSSGKATFAFTPKKPDGTGTYTLDARAEKSGYDRGEASTTFEVR